MGNCVCNADESVLNTPLGNCSIKHCGCWGKKEAEAKKEGEQEDEIIKQLNVAIKAELATVELEMRKQMLAALQLHKEKG